MTRSTSLRKLLAGPEVLILPGVFDVHSAQLAQAAGFDSLYLGGFATSASQVGLPDWGLATMTEMLAIASGVNHAIKVPLICDVDQGFGSITNLSRAVQCYEASGIAAIHFEDQPFPKKCSQQPNRSVIPLDEAVKRVKVAVESRSDPNFILIARTDAKNTEGMSGIKSRIDAYLNAGADYCIFCEQASVDELVDVGREFPGQVITFVGDDAENEACCLPATVYKDMGYAAVFYCALGICAAHRHLKNTYNHLMDNRHLSPEFLRSNVSTLGEVQKITGIEKWQTLRDKYGLL